MSGEFNDPLAKNSTIKLWQGKDRSFTTRGANSRMTTLTEETARAIKIAARSGDGRSDAEIASAFGVSRTIVYNIRTGRRWGHIKIEDES